MREIPFNNDGISGVLHLPNKKSPLIIMCHGWGCSKLGTLQGLFVKAAREFCKKGFAVMRFDFRGSGDSEGEFGCQTIETMIEDLDKVLNSLNSSVDTDKIGLIGHSLGGKIAIMKAAKDKRIKCLTLWSTPGLHQEILSKAFVDEVRERKYLHLNDVGYGISLKQLESCLKSNGLEALKRIEIPTMIINGSEDMSVPPSHAKKLYKASNSPKKIAIIKGADHVFMSEAHSRRLIKLTADWFERWLTTRSGK